MLLDDAGARDLSKLDRPDREQPEQLDRESLIGVILILQQQFGAQQELGQQL